jgi:hypothetical protein
MIAGNVNSTIAKLNTLKDHFIVWELYPPINIEKIKGKSISAKRSTGHPKPSHRVERKFGSMVGCFSIPKIPIPARRNAKTEKTRGCVPIIFFPNDFRNKYPPINTESAKIVLSIDSLIFFARNICIAKTVNVVVEKRIENRELG